LRLPLPAVPRPEFQPPPPFAPLLQDIAAKRQARSHDKNQANTKEAKQRRLEPNGDGVWDLCPLTVASLPKTCLKPPRGAAGPKGGGVGRAVVGDGGSNSQAKLPGLVLRASFSRAILPPLTDRPGDREPCATRGRDPSWNPDIVNPSGNTTGTQVEQKQKPGRTQVEHNSSLLVLTYRAMRLHPGPLPTTSCFLS
jgi:hypothetical protein